MKREGGGRGREEEMERRGREKSGYQRT